MASNRIRGITVEIGGDMTKLDKALQGTNKNISTTASKLKDVERLLKLDPGNVELLDQKQRLLAQSVEATSDKLVTLKNVLETSTASNVKYEEWQKAFSALQGQVTKTTKALTEAEKELERLNSQESAPDSSQMVEAQDKVEGLKDKLAALEQQITDTYDALGRPISIDQWDDLQRELAETSDQAKTAQDSFDSFSPSLSAFSSKASELSDKAGAVADATKGISLAAGGVLTALMGSVAGTEEFRSDLSKLETNAERAGVGIASVDEALKQLNSVSDETDSSVESLSNLLQAGATESNLQRAVEGLAGAAIAFPDTVKIESLADSLQETLATGSATGQFAEVLDRLGVGAEEFNAQLAQVPGEANKLNFALDTLANQGMADVYNSWKESEGALIENKNATFEFKKSLAALAEDMQPLMTTVTNLARAFLDWFSGLSEGQQKAIVTLLAITAAISPVASAISSVGNAVKLVTDNFGLLKKGASAVFSLFASNPMLAAILAVIAALALLILNWDKVKETVENVINAVVSFVQKAIDAVKEFFSVLGGGSSNQPRSARGTGFGGDPALGTQSLDDYPHFAAGGVFAPNNPMLSVLGDNRTEYEVAAPESMLRDTFLEALASSGLADQRVPASGSRPVVFQLDGRTFARLIVPYLRTESARLGIDMLDR